MKELFCRSPYPDPRIYVPVEKAVFFDPESAAEWLPLKFILPWDNECCELLWPSDEGPYFILDCNHVRIPLQRFVCQGFIGPRATHWRRLRNVNARG